MTVPFKLLLVPVDLSSCSADALKLALALAVIHQAAVDVLLVVPAEEAAPFAASREALRQFVAAAPGVGSVTLRQHVEQGDVRERILSLAERAGSHAIVLGTHGRTGRARALAGSIAESVVRTAACPVITVRGRS